MWTADTVAEWIADLGIRPGGAVDVEMVVVGGPGIWFPTMPDRVAVIEMVPGPGLFMGEGQMDGTEFRLSIRGPQGDPNDADRNAELMALAADQLIRGFDTPAELSDGTYLLSIDRSARPTLVERGREGGRVTYSATYTAQVNDEG